MYMNKYVNYLKAEYLIFCFHQSRNQYLVMDKLSEILLNEPTYWWGSQDCLCPLLCKSLQLYDMFVTAPLSLLIWSQRGILSISLISLSPQSNFD